VHERSEARERAFEVAVEERQRVLLHWPRIQPSRRARAFGKTETKVEEEEEEEEEEGKKQHRYLAFNFLKSSQLESLAGSSVPENPPRAYSNARTRVLVSSPFLSLSSLASL